MCCISCITGRLLKVRCLLIHFHDFRVSYCIRELTSLLAYQLISQSVQSLKHGQLCNPMDCTTPGLPVHHQLPELIR